MFIWACVMQISSFCLGTHFALAQSSRWVNMQKERAEYLYSFQTVPVKILIRFYSGNSLDLQDKCITKVATYNLRSDYFIFFKIIERHIWNGQFISNSLRRIQHLKSLFPKRELLWTYYESIHSCVSTGINQWITCIGAAAMERIRCTDPVAFTHSKQSLQIY